MTRGLDINATDLAEVERIVRAAGTSFYRGMRILPPDRRAAMYGIYAFCRIVDDIADEPADLADKQAGLADWRGRIKALAQGRAGDAVTRVLLAATQKFSLREADFLAVIDGMQTDAETTVVAPSAQALDVYCDQVAAAVGRLSVRAFGDASANADTVAYHLGRALQLTNILRDLAEDAGRGRLYLPREALDHAGVPADPAIALHHPGLTQVCVAVAAEARQHFADTFTAMRLCDAAAMRPARAMAASYRAVLARLERRGWQHPDRPVTVPAWQKLFIALRYSLGS